MSYGAGMLNERVAVLRRVSGGQGAFGRNSGASCYELCGTVAAAVDWSRGVKSMREGALDAYDTVMVRCRWTGLVDRNCLLLHGGRTYQVVSLHADRRRNTVQMTVREQVEQPGGRLVVLHGLKESGGAALEDAGGEGLFVKELE